MSDWPDEYSQPRLVDPLHAARVAAHKAGVELIEADKSCPSHGWDAQEGCRWCEVHAHWIRHTRKIADAPGKKIEDDLYRRLSGDDS